MQKVLHGIAQWYNHNESMSHQDPKPEINLYSWVVNMDNLAFLIFPILMSYPIFQ